MTPRVASLDQGRRSSTSASDDDARAHRPSARSFACMENGVSVRCRERRLPAFATASHAHPSGESPIPAFLPASQLELHRPPRWTTDGHVGRETRAKDPATLRGSPPRAPLERPRHRPVRTRGMEVPLVCAKRPRPPSNTAPRRAALSEGSGRLRPFRNPRVVGGWISAPVWTISPSRRPFLAVGIASVRSAFVSSPEVPGI